jgi:hypothetical protein
MKKIRVNDKVLLTENTRCLLGLPDGIEYIVKEILVEENIPFPIVLKSDELGEDWVNFFNNSELIPK